MWFFRAACAISALLCFARGDAPTGSSGADTGALLSLQDLQSMIAALEERQRTLPFRNSSVPRRLDEHSHADHAAGGDQHSHDHAAGGNQGMSPVKKATCSFDIIGVVLAVARTGTVLWFVQDTCKVQDTVDQKAACAAVIIGLFSNLGFLISFMSDAIAQCQKTLVVPALCSANVGNMIAVLSITGSTISSLQVSCRTVTAMEPKWREYLPDAAAKYDAFKVTKRQYSRRLRGDVPMQNHSVALAGLPHKAATLPGPPTQRFLAGNLLQEIRSKLTAAEFRKVEISQCVFDALLTAMFFGRGLLDLYNTAMHSPCTHEEDFTNPTEQDATCLVQISNLITAFDFVGALLALLYSECPAGADLKALCAADVIISVGAITALVQTGAAFLLVCGDLEEDVDHVVSDIGGGIVI